MIPLTTVESSYDNSLNILACFLLFDLGILTARNAHAQDQGQVSHVPFVEFLVKKRLDLA